MSYETIIRAWKNEAYRNSLSAEDLALLPANPAGVIELTDADLTQANGRGFKPMPFTGREMCEAF